MVPVSYAPCSHATPATNRPLHDPGTRSDMLHPSPPVPRRRRACDTTSGPGSRRAARERSPAAEPGPESTATGRAPAAEDTSERHAVTGTDHRSRGCSVATTSARPRLNGRSSPCRHPRGVQRDGQRVPAGMGLRPVELRHRCGADRRPPSASTDAPRTTWGSHGDGCPTGFAGAERSPPACWRIYLVGLALPADTGPVQGRPGRRGLGGAVAQGAGDRPARHGAAWRRSRSAECSPRCSGARLTQANGAFRPTWPRRCCSASGTSCRRGTSTRPTLCSATCCLDRSGRLRPSRRGGRHRCRRHGPVMAAQPFRQPGRTGDAALLDQQPRLRPAWIVQNRDFDRRAGPERADRPGVKRRELDAIDQLDHAEHQQADADEQRQHEHGDLGPGDRAGRRPRRPWHPAPPAGPSAGSSRGPDRDPRPGGRR